jgi:hypothetical protein
LLQRDDAPTCTCRHAARITSRCEHCTARARACPNVPRTSNPKPRARSHKSTYYRLNRITPFQARWLVLHLVRGDESAERGARAVASSSNSLQTACASDNLSAECRCRMSCRRVRPHARTRQRLWRRKRVVSGLWPLTDPTHGWWCFKHTRDALAHCGRSILAYLDCAICKMRALR